MFLVAVLVIGVMAVATSLSLMLLGWAAEQNGLALMQSNQAYEYAQTCAERGLLALRKDVSYTGSEHILLARGSCEILGVTGSGNEDRMLCVQGTSGKSVRAMEIHIATILPATHIATWREVPTITLCP